MTFSTAFKLRFNWLPLLGLCFFAASCNKDDVPGTAAAAAFAACTTPNPGSSEHSCPGVSGTWNNYAIVTDHSGSVISNDVYCGATDGDVPTTQADFDSRLVSAGETSGGDFHHSSDCSSGTEIANSTQNITIHVWRKQ